MNENPKVIIKPKEIRKQMLIASYDLTENTSICPAKELKKMIGDRVLYGEVSSPDLSNCETAEERWNRLFTIDKNKEVIKLSNIKVENKLVNTETQEEVRADYVYNENHFIRLIVYADVEITNEDLAKEYNITFDNIQFATRNIIEKHIYKDTLKYIFTYDVTEHLNMDVRLRIKDISFKDSNYLTLNR